MNKFLLLIGFFWTLYIARIAYDTVLYQGVLGRPTMHYWIWGIGSCLIPFLGIISRNARFHDIKVFRFFFAIVFITLILSILFGSTTKLQQGELVHTMRFQLDALNAISLGNVGGISVTLALWRLSLTRQLPMKLSQTVFFVLIAFLGLYLILLTGSRGPLIALLATSLIVAFYSSISSKIFYILFGAGLFSFGYYLLQDFSDVLGINSLDRILRLGTDRDLSSVGRLDMITTAVEDFFSSPILGAGLEVRAIAFYPHNLIIESYMATGIFGGIAFTLSLLVVLVFAKDLLKARLPGSWVAVIFMYYFILSLFSGTLYQSGFFWASIGAVLAVYRSEAGIRKVHSSTLPLERPL